MLTIVEAILANVRARFAPQPPPPMPLPLSPAWFAEQSAAREAATEPRTFAHREFATAPPPPERAFSIREFAISAPLPEVGPDLNLVRSPMVVPPGISFD